MDAHRNIPCFVAVRPSLVQKAGKRWNWAEILVLNAEAKLMIRVRDLNVSYDGTPALQDISFDVQAGECLVITGLSGCGKSTLARVLMGVIPQTIPAKVSGTVEVGGMDVFSHPTTEVAKQVGAVFQNPRSHLFHLRVDDEIAFGPRNLGLPAEESRRRAWIGRWRRWG